MHRGPITILSGLVTFCVVAAAYAVNLDPNVLAVEGDPGHPRSIYREADLAKSFTPQEITTRTPWSNGVERTYRGYSLPEILAKNGLADVKVITGVAPNDFAARIDVRDIFKYQPIVASQIICDAAEARMGKCTEGRYRPLEADDYGPFFVVWPFDKLPKAYEPNDHSRWIWFLSELREDE